MKRLLPAAFLSALLFPGRVAPRTIEIHSEINKGEHVPGNAGLYEFHLFAQPDWRGLAAVQFSVPVPDCWPGGVSLGGI